MKTKLLTIAMTAALMLTAMTKVQAQNYEGPCLPSSHGLTGHQSAFCGSILTQTIALSAGTNWVSFYVDTDLDALKAALLEASNNASGTTIATKGTQTFYNGSKWRGALNALDFANMYKITVSTECEIQLEGMPLDPSQITFTITEGANWIAFPLQESMSLTDAFAGFAINGDGCKTKGSQAVYNNRWRGALNTLVPGQGYIYQSAATGDRTFTFPIIAK